ncbi:aminoglycoside phosphotransferase family protein [Saccharopolyspora sp. NPDC003752]
MNDQNLERLRALARSAGYDPADITSPPQTHATGTVVRIRSTETSLIGKIHRSRTLHQREVSAYREWTPHLADAAPRLLAVDPDLPGIVITAVPGRPLDELDLPQEAERAAFRQAGHLLRRLHQIPVTGHAPQITSYLAERAEHWIARTTLHLTRHDTQRIRHHMQRLMKITTARVTACHLDFQPRNLLWHPGQGLRLIDFEHARIDLAARDLVRMTTRHFAQRPDLKAAFFAGYGPLNESDAAVLAHCTVLDGLTTLAYGHRNSDPAFIQHGRALLSPLHQPTPR